MVLGVGFRRAFCTGASIIPSRQHSLRGPANTACVAKVSEYNATGSPASRLTQADLASASSQHPAFRGRFQGTMLAPHLACRERQPCGQED